MMNSLLEYANAVGDGWAVWVMTTLLDSAVLLALTALLWFVIRKRVAPQVGYCLFLLVPLKVLVPVSVTVPSAIAQWTPSAFVSAWFDDARVLEDGPPNEGPLATSITEQSASAESSLELNSQSMPVAADTRQPDLPIKSRARREPAFTSGLANDFRSPRLSMSATIAIVWLIGVLLLLGRLALTQLRFQARLQRSLPLDASRLLVNLRDLCRRVGITQTIRVVESDCVAAPAVWGITQPTIILPQGVASSMTAQQLQWILLHELAHIKRRDLLVVVLQRFVAILHFFNPAVWIANRVVHRLREYACDDLAVALSDGSAIEGSEAFLQILRHANGRPRGLEGALGIFGLDSRAACFLRVNRLLDSARPIRTRSGPWALCGLILLAMVTLPHLRAGSDGQQSDPPPAVKETAKPNKLQAKPDPVEALISDTGEFELRVVGPDGKPVPEAQVELRISPHPTAEHIRRGKYVKTSTYGPYAKTDAEGRLVIAVPQKPSRFDMDITTPGYAPYWAGWTNEGQTQPIPARFTAELESGWSVGGIIVDNAGKPIAGVKVRPSIQFKKRPGDQAALGMGSNLKTDDAGKWRFDSVPVSKSQVFVEIDHSEFMPLRRPLTRTEFGLEAGREPLRTIVLEKGLTVTGKVTDKAGVPIVGALIRTKFHNDIREATTGADGVYRLTGCEPRMTKIVVSAKGRATDMQKIRIDPQMEPVNFQMQPGGMVRIHVLDAQGKPVPKARIFFQRWRGRFDYFEFNHVSQYANEKGVWEWHEAPLDEFKADICPPDGMNLAEQPLIPRDQPYVFRLPPPFVVSGKVIDAETKQPIKTFLVVPGIRFSATQMNWARGEQETATDGKYSLRKTQDYFAYMVRIEAEGYQPAVSRDIKTNEGAITIDFELKKGVDVSAIVLTPEGKPAARAQVGLGVAGSQLTVQNGKLENSTLSPQQETNDSGQFRFPPQPTEFQLLIVHPTGYAHVKGTPESVPKTIQLEAWARVEGTFRIGKNPMPNVPITINAAGLHSPGDDVSTIFTRHDVTTEKDGRFVFERVIPGKARIGRLIILMVDDGALAATSSTMIAADFAAGKTTQMDLGGFGQPVVGKLQPPDGFKGKVNWNFAIIYVETSGAAENLPLHEFSPEVMATVDRHGTFRIDDLPAGSYRMSVRFDREPPGMLRDHRFTIPPIDGGRSDTPFDLGVLTLDKS
jgi:beta-lactamase regulating signal transducer with metallopeptidase domain